jgi:hypothetical protein
MSLAFRDIESMKKVFKNSESYLVAYYKVEINKSHFLRYTVWVKKYAKQH